MIAVTMGAQANLGMETTWTPMPTIFQGHRNVEPTKTIPCESLYSGGEGERYIGGH
jgi:hypothetical protein